MWIVKSEKLLIQANVFSTSLLSSLFAINTLHLKRFELIRQFKLGVKGMMLLGTVFLMQNLHYLCNQQISLYVDSCKSQLNLISKGIS